jgi:fatty-acyl-CoA synthase
LIAEFDFFKMDVLSQIKAFIPPRLLRALADQSLLSGLLLGAALSPLLAPVVLLVLPLVTLVLFVLAALSAYAMLGPLQAKGRDFRYFAKAAVTKVCVGLCVVRNALFDEAWDRTLARVGRHHVLMHFVDEDRAYSSGELEADSNRIARVALLRGLKAGDTVALLMRNRPEYVAVWLGLAKIGVRTALINTNQKRAPLVHSFKEAHCRAIICEAALADLLADVEAELPAETSGNVFAYAPGSTSGPDAGKTVPTWMASLDQLLLTVSAAPLDAKQRARANGVKVGDALLYVYTSGTTGLPKAAKISHLRLWLITYGFSNMCDVGADARIYNPLPLYHSAGGLIGVGLTLFNGAFMVTRRKFSASGLVKDVRANDCNTLQYIGEMCRFAITAPPSADDAASGIKKAIGNGLRPDVWPVFQERFGIERIYEFYAATEGAAALINIEGKEGAIGFVSPLVDPLLKLRVAKATDDGELVRDAAGRCVLVPRGEAGEMLMEIQATAGARNFDGYQSAEATAKKVARDVLKPGDMFFRSGDLLRVDADGFVFFVDRLGETFRWKGENCSTAEVASAVQAALGDAVEICVYGSAVPANDGRAGTVAIVAEPSDVDLAKLYKHAKQELPPYAVPVFLRFTKELEKTSTMKLIKTGLVKAGVDPAQCAGDKLFVADASKGTYVPLDQTTFAQIASGSVRL